MAMEPKIMITNGGTHPPEKWAELSAAEIIQVGENPVGRKLELKILDALETFFTHVQETEKAQLDEDGDGRLESPIDGQEHDAEEVIAEIMKAAEGTEFAAHFQRPEVHQHIRNVLAHHAALTMDVERSWFADSSDTEAAAKFRNSRIGAPESEEVSAPAPTEPEVLAKPEAPVVSPKK